MTEPERHLTALEKLAGRFETEQRRYFRLIKTLQQRFHRQAVQNETLRR